MQIEALKYGLEFEYADIFNYPTIRQLSKKLPSPEEKFMSNYNYSKIDKILQNNCVENIKNISKYDVKNILRQKYTNKNINDKIKQNEG